MAFLRQCLQQVRASRQAEGLDGRALSPAGSLGAPASVGHPAEAVAARAELPSWAKLREGVPLEPRKSLNPTHILLGNVGQMIRCL